MQIIVTFLVCYTIGPNRRRNMCRSALYFQYTLCTFSVSGLKTMLYCCSFLCSPSLGSWKYELIRVPTVFKWSNFWTRSPWHAIYSLLPRSGQMEDDCGSEIVMALPPLLHINAGVLPSETTARCFSSAAPLSLLQLLEQQGRKKKNTRGEEIICSVCPSLSVSGAFKWTVIQPFMSTSKIRKTHMYKMKGRTVLHCAAGLHSDNIYT